MEGLRSAHEAARGENKKKTPMINKRKLAVIHIAKAQCRLDDESYRAMLRAEGGVASSRDLDTAGFNRLMRRFEKLGFVSTSKQQRRDRRKTANRRGLITREQQALIHHNYELLAKASATAGQPGFHSMNARTAFNRRQCRKAFPQTRGDGMKVIEGQKRLLDRFLHSAQQLVQC